MQFQVTKATSCRVFIGCMDISHTVGKERVKISLVSVYRVYSVSTNNILVWIFFIASGVGLSPLYCGHFWPIVPAPDDR
jgi:hypothetical protein